MRVPALVIVLVAATLASLVTTPANALAPIRQLQRHLVDAELTSDVEVVNTEGDTVEAEDAEAELVEAEDVDGPAPAASAESSFIDTEGEKPGRSRARKRAQARAKHNKRKSQDGNKPKKDKKKGNGGKGKAKTPAGPAHVPGTATPSSPKAKGGPDAFNQEMSKEIAKVPDLPESDPKHKEAKAKKKTMADAAADGKLSPTEVDANMSKQAEKAQKKYRRDVKRKIKERGKKLSNEIKKETDAAAKLKKSGKSTPESEAASAAKLSGLQDKLKTAKEREDRLLTQLATKDVDHRIEKQLGGHPTSRQNLKLLDGDVNSQSGTDMRAAKDRAQQKTGTPTIQSPVTGPGATPASTPATPPASPAAPATPPATNP